MSTKLATLPTEADQKALGQQIEEQYHRANPGLVENIALGALIEQAQKIVSTCGHDRPRGGGRDTAGEGLKGWLEQFAPTVTRPTAYRCLALAEGVRTELKIGAKADLYEILKGAKPDDRAKALREKVENFVAGKSQRTLLIGIGKPDAQQGGARTTTKKKATPEEEREAWIQMARSRAVSAFDAIHTLDDSWQVLEDKELRLAKENAEKLAKQLGKWLDTPKPQRPALNIEQRMKEGK